MQTCKFNDDDKHKRPTKVQCKSQAQSRQKLTVFTWTSISPHSAHKNRRNKKNICNCTPTHTNTHTLTEILVRIFTWTQPHQKYKVTLHLPGFIQHVICQRFSYHQITRQKGTRECVCNFQSMSFLCLIHFWCLVSVTSRHQEFAHIMPNVKNSETSLVQNHVDAQFKDSI